MSDDMAAWNALLEELRSSGASITAALNQAPSSELSEELAAEVHDPFADLDDNMFEDYVSGHVVELPSAVEDDAQTGAEANGQSPPAAAVIGGQTPDESGALVDDETQQQPVDETLSWTVDDWLNHCGPDLFFIGYAYISVPARAVGDPPNPLLRDPLAPRPENGVVAPIGHVSFTTLAPEEVADPAVWSTHLIIAILSPGEEHVVRTMKVTNPQGGPLSREMLDYYEQMDRAEVRGDSFGRLWFNSPDSIHAAHLRALNRDIPAPSGYQPASMDATHLHALNTQFFDSNSAVRQGQWNPAAHMAPNNSTLARSRQPALLPGPRPFGITNPAGVAAPGGISAPGGIPAPANVAAPADNHGISDGRAGINKGHVTVPLQYNCFCGDADTDRMIVCKGPRHGPMAHVGSRLYHQACVLPEHSWISPNHNWRCWPCEEMYARVRAEHASQHAAAMRRSSVPFMSRSSVPVTSSSSVPVTPSSSVPAMSRSSFPVMSRSAVPATSRSSIPATPRSSIPATPRSSVPAMSRSSVPAMSRSSVPAMSRSSVPAMSRSSVPATSSSSVPVTSSSSVPVMPRLPPVAEPWSRESSPEPTLAGPQAARGERTAPPDGMTYHDILERYNVEDTGRKYRTRKRWSLREHNAVIAALIFFCVDLPRVKGALTWRMVSHYIMVHHNVNRAPLACRSQWCRQLREETGIDERKVPNPGQMRTSVKIAQEPEMVRAKQLLEERFVREVMSDEEMDPDTELEELEEEDEALLMIPSTPSRDNQKRALSSAAGPQSAKRRRY